MERASKGEEPAKILGILYNQCDSILYGYILFFKYRLGGQPVKPYDQSAVFGIAETLGSDQVVVYGSIENFVLQST